MVPLLVSLLCVAGCRTPVARKLPQSPHPLSRLEVLEFAGTHATDVLKVLKSRKYVDIVHTENTRITSQQLNECDEFLVIRPDNASDIASVVMGKRIDQEGRFVTEVNEVWFYCDRDGVILGAGTKSSSYGF